MPQWAWSVPARAGARSFPAAACTYEGGSALSKSRSKKKYRAGVIGCGSTSGHFFTGWAPWLDEVEVAAICDVAPTQMQRQQQAFPDVCGQAATYTDYRKMLAEAGLDIVGVCSFSDRHMEHTEACLEAGKHVFVEKPIGYNLEEARRFKHLAAKYPDLKGGVAYSLRYYKAFMDLKALIASGVLGEITSCEISYSHGRHGRGREVGTDESGAGSADASAPRRAARRPRRRPYEDGGGNYIASSELTHATHPWDMARYLLGEVREVFCARAHGATMGILWMESGAMCHVMSGSVRRAKVGHMQQQIVQAHGREGSAWLTREKDEPYRWRAHYKTDGDIQEAPAVSDVPESSHGAVLRSRNLLDAIEGKAELICSLVDGATTTELLHALWLSERMQVRVPVFPANHTG